MVSYEVLIGIWLILGAVNLLAYAIVDTGGDATYEDTWFVGTMVIVLLAAGPLVVAPMVYAAYQETRYH
jgi:hypothetical protein